MANDPFRALSHPTRRRIVERLAAGPLTVGQATADLDVSKPVISKHLKVLEEEGVIDRVVVGRTHRLSLRPEALAAVGDWTRRQQTRWAGAFDAVEAAVAARPPEEDDR